MIHNIYTIILYVTCIYSKIGSYFKNFSFYFLIFRSMSNLSKFWCGKTYLTILGIEWRLLHQMIDGTFKKKNYYQRKVLWLKVPVSFIVIVSVCSTRTGLRSRRPQPVHSWSPFKGTHNREVKNDKVNIIINVWVRVPPMLRNGDSEEIALVVIREELKGGYGVNEIVQVIFLYSYPEEEKLYRSKKKRT